MRWLLPLLTTLAACEPPPYAAYPPPGELTDVPGTSLPSSDAIMPMYGFSWVIEGTLAGMPQPGGSAPLDQDLAFLAEEELDLLVSLTETGTDPAAVADAGIQLLHLPVPDMTAPSQDQIDAFVARAGGVIDDGGRVGVHCLAGKGRTGTFLATWFVHAGLDAETAMGTVRALRPGSIETEAQEDAVREYAARLQDPPTDQ